MEEIPFPSLYLEFPLAGDPFLDVTALYGEVASGTRFHSEAAAGTERMIDWFAQVSAQYNDLSFGFELDDFLYRRCCLLRHAQKNLFLMMWKSGQTGGYL